MILCSIGKKSYDKEQKKRTVPLTNSISPWEKLLFEEIGLNFLISPTIVVFEGRGRDKGVDGRWGTDAKWWEGRLVIIV